MLSNFSLTFLIKLFLVKTFTEFDGVASTSKPSVKWTTTAPPSGKSMLRHTRSFQVVFKSFAARFKSFQLVLIFINYVFKFTVID